MVFQSRSEQRRQQRIKNMTSGVIGISVNPITLVKAIIKAPTTIKKLFFGIRRRFKKN